MELTLAHRDLDGVLQWLRPSAGGQVVQQADEPMQGTHQWINSNICITEWLDVESQKILFVEGRPGFGKSVLAARLAEICRQRSDSPLVILYEFSNQSGPSTLAASILSQLLHCPEIQPDDKALKLIVTELQELGNENRLGPSGCRFIKLWDLALRALAIPRTKWAQVFVIVDGLDQYDFNTNISLMGFLESLKDSSRVARVRVAVFTRPQCEILSFASSFPSRCLQVSLTEELLASDIELFAANKFDSLQIPSRFNDMTLERIRQDAKGSFLWAKLLLKYLSEPWTEIEYLERLRGCPPDLSSTYDTMLEDGAALFTKDTPGAAARHRFSQQRRKTLLLVCEAREPLSLVEIGRAVSIGHYNVEKTLMDRCKPLLFVSEARLHFIHASAKEYLTDQSRLRFVTGEEGAILFRASDSHRSLAWECLSCLLDPEYAEKGRIGYFIHRSFGKFLQEELIPEPSRGLSFRYAARHWDFHLTAIEDPDAELLETTRQFIDSFQFAFWSEWSIERTGNTSRVFDVWRALRTWTASLPKDKQALICLDDYFVGPYLALSEAYRDAEAEDKVLQWLALMRVGRYYVDKGETEKAMPIRREVKDGLIAVLGTSHPLTLRARTDYGLSQTFEGNYQEAYDEFKAIVEIEENSYGETSKELYRTLMAMGETELYLLLFHDSVSTQEKAALGFLKFYSQDSKQYLSARMWLCYPLIELGKLDVAFEILFYVFQKRTEGYGPDDMFAASSRFSMGGIQRKQGNREAIKSLEEAFRVRHQLYNLTSMWALDFAIELLIAYRDFGEEAKAAKLLEDLDSEGAGDRLFNRHCQVEHVRSLLRWDSGKRDQAIDLLQGLLIAADREDYNRALLWIALDLALMLRARGGEGDNHQAEANFDHILVDCKLSSSSSHRCVRQRLIDKKSGRNSGNAETHSVRVIEALASWRSGAKDKEQHTSDDKSAREEVYNSGDMEPDPPHTLRLAEKALTLVRNRKFAEVDELMREEQFDWFRVQDLWLWSGGPAADTSWMRPPLGVTSVIFHGFTAAAPTAAEEYG
ncbi:hypothetical protein B0H63DRAFT_449209 [Podospora didyma]|uniref:Nephrocystin 3-like N-terminal domain-containing protein n=1 Tax=Podospora didyma TaxID=330526 RepID=A0AAE0NP51_9PEZI|nr:hypothetical protein B0H63DRAFT_449209 [Podospora didyma]